MWLKCTYKWLAARLASQCNIDCFTMTTDARCKLEGSMVSYCVPVLVNL